ncbi:MAG TPA: phosphorylase [Microscillaceae bacterium]|jgi:uridine phosphorylase|nr:phosphorylase [Microscillaceae bacterium]
MKASELILNPDGSIYHLNLRPEDIADVIITVGDQNRVAQVSKYFDSIRVQKAHREFVTHTGRLGSQEITVISSGIGTDNVEILLTELDALVNIDLIAKVVKSQHRKLKIIRLGTSGSIRAEIPAGSLVASAIGVGLDTLMQFYVHHPEAESKELVVALQKHLGLGFLPYIAQASPYLWQNYRKYFTAGNTLTLPGFYAPQGREIRLKSHFAEWITKIQAFDYQEFQFTNFEMETAGYYALGALLGHEMLSLNAIIANRATGEFVTEPEKVVESLIQLALNHLPTIQ